MLLAETTQQIPAAPVLIFMAIGVLLALVGHASKSRGTTVAGLFILFMATAAMLVGGFFAYQQEETDPRDEKPPSQPSF